MDSPINIFGFKIPKVQLFHGIFHFLFWSIWIGFPFLTDPEESTKKQFAIAYIPIVLSNIPLFLINAHWLIPKVFAKKGLVKYLGSLLVLCLLFVGLQMLLTEWTVPHQFIRQHWDFAQGLSHVLFVIGLSSGYGFLFLFWKKEQIANATTEAQLKSEVSFLRSQISPHFFFNILNSIVYLIRTKSDLAESVTIKLSDLMRYMLYESANSQVPLEKEVNYLENYMDLQRIRFEEDVDIQFTKEGKLENQLIEPMLLIPFVENAFKHGIGMVADPFIKVHLKATPYQLEFRVDNKITRESSAQKDPNSGIGLINVERRLALLYPDRHQLAIKKESGIFEVLLTVNFSS